MANVAFDKHGYFGDVTLASGTVVFPNVIDLGKTDADRYQADIFANGITNSGATSADLVVTVQGTNDDPTGTPAWVDVGKNTIPQSVLAQGKGAVSISPNPYRYIRVALTIEASTITGGSAAAQLDTYVGK